MVYFDNTSTCFTDHMVKCEYRHGIFWQKHVLVFHWLWTVYRVLCRDKHHLSEMSSYRLLVLWHNYYCKWGYCQFGLVDMKIILCAILIYRCRLTNISYIKKAMVFTFTVVLIAFHPSYDTISLNDKLFIFSIIPWGWHDTRSWNPSSWNTRTHFPTCASTQPMRDDVTL